jgi:uncharacterized membrane protein YdjX (TVP38/TMEM64 family)
MRFGDRVRLFWLFVLVVLAVVLSKWFSLSPAAIRDFVGSYGIFSPIIFILSYIFLTVLFFPGTVLTVSGGILFGAYFS